MKRLTGVLIILFVSLSFVYSENFFSERFFEIKLNTQVGVSNSTFGLFDYFKPEITIDLTKIADEMPEEGFSFIGRGNQSVEIGLNVKPGLKFALSTGFDLYSDINISKDLFDFLGYGNNLNEELNIDIDGYSDLFLYLQTDIGWNTNKFTFIVSPSIYFTLMHASIDNSNIKLINTPDGVFAYSLTGNLSICTDLPLTSIINDYNYIFDQWENLYSNLIDNMGVDVEVYCSYDYNKFLTLFGDVKCPVIPSRLNTKIPMTLSSSFSTSLDDLASNNLSAPDFDYSGDGAVEEEYVINRPMKITFGANFHPFNDLMEYYGSFGVGIVHPFSEVFSDVDWYIDYDIGIRVGLLNAFSIYVESERLDRLFSQKLMLELNLRYVAVKEGVATQSPDFENSFRGAGIGGFATCSVGF